MVDWAWFCIVNLKDYSSRLGLAMAHQP
jgi:hypothetical protein